MSATCLSLRTRAKARHSCRHCSSRDPDAAADQHTYPVMPPCHTSPISDRVAARNPQPGMHTPQLCPCCRQIPAGTHTVLHQHACGEPLKLLVACRLSDQMVSGARPSCTPLLCDLDWSTRRLSGSSACDRKSGTPLLLLPWCWLLLCALPFLLLDDPPNQLATRPITPCST